MMKKLLIAILFFGFVGILNAQNAQYTLQERLNLPRVGDVEVKLELSPVIEGNNGENVLWDFSAAEIIREDYGILYIPPIKLESGWYLMIDKDTIPSAENIIIRHDYPQRTNYYYELKDSILYLLGHQNRLDKMKHYEPVPYLKFPMSYGEKQTYDTRSKDFFSNSVYLHINGNETIEADAYGTIILPNVMTGGDTLKDVLRIHSVHHQLSDSVEEMRTIHVDTKIETYRWYARGYRYPVFEVKRTYHRIDDEIDTVWTSYCYPPVMQLQNEDAENASEREEMAREEEILHQSTNPWEGMTYSVYPNPVYNDLTFELYLPKPVNNLHIRVHTPMGMVAIDQNKGSYSAGTHSFTFNVGHLRRNSYYILDFWLDGYFVQGSTVLKK